MSLARLWITHITKPVLIERMNSLSHKTGKIFQFESLETYILSLTETNQNGMMVAVNPCILILLVSKEYLKHHEFQ